MKTNEILREQIFEIVENQMTANNPPETKKAYQRLLTDGYSKFQAKQFIGQCVAVELFKILKFKEPFNEIRYIKNLQKLPEEPFDD
jgi:hypothetical protein